MLLAGECAIVAALVCEKSSRVEVTIVGGGFLSDSGTVRLVLK